MNYQVLKKYVKESVFTMEDVATLIGMSYSTFNWRAKNNAMQVKDLVAIVELLDLSSEDLLKIIYGKEQ